MYAGEDIDGIFAQCREHYDVSAAIEEASGENNDQDQQQNDENSNGSQQERKGSAPGGGSSSSSIERSEGSLDASSGGYEASCSSSSSQQTPNFANGSRSRSGGRARSDTDKKPAVGLAQSSAVPTTKSVSFAGIISPSSNNCSRKHSRGRGFTDHNAEPASKASGLESKKRTRKSDPHDDDAGEDSEMNGHLLMQHQAQRQLQLQDNELTIEQAMMLCTEPRILTLSSEPYIVVHVNASFSKLTGVDSHIQCGKPVETVFFHSCLALGKGGSGADKSSSIPSYLSSSSSSSSSSTAIISKWMSDSICSDRVVDVVCRERYGSDIGPSRDKDILSRLQGTKRCRLMISRVCSFEQSSSSSISSGTCSSSRETSNTDLSSGDDTGAVLPDGGANEGDADRQSDDSGDPELTKMTTHYLLQLVPCQLLVGPQSLSSDRKQRRGGGHRGSSTKDETMFVIG